MKLDAVGLSYCTARFRGYPACGVLYSYPRRGGCELKKNNAYPNLDEFDFANLELLPSLASTRGSQAQLRVRFDYLNST